MTAVCPTPLVDNPVGVDGGVTSEHALVATNAIAREETLPAGSSAETPSV